MTKHAYTVEFEKSVLKRLLGTNETWAKKALMRIYDAQTCDEKQGGEFTGTDAKLLTRIAKWYAEHDFIGAGYMKVLYSRMPKYAGQIFSLPDFDHEKFDRQIEALIGAGMI